MTDRAAFTQCFVLEDEGLRLIAMALGARLIESRQSQTAGRFHDVRAMWIVALYAIHFAFKHGMMLRQAEFGVSVQMTLEASGRIFAWIQDEFSTPAPDSDMLAARTMTGFAPAGAGLRIRREVHPGMSAGGKLLNVIGVTGQAGLVTDVFGPGDVCRHKHDARNCGTGIHCHQHHKPGQQGDDSRQPSRPLAGQIHARSTHARPP
jgi:hypothetical protein